MSSADPSPTPPRARLRWKYVIVGGVLASWALLCLGIAGLIYTFRDSLPELDAKSLAAAEERWESQGPARYDLDLKLGGSTPGTVHVEVRDGEVTAMTRDGRTPSQRRTWEVWTVEGQFEMMHRELELAADPQGEMQADSGTRLVLRAEFDPLLGYPRRFRRHVLGHGPEVSWEVTEFRAIR